MPCTYTESAQEIAARQSATNRKLVAPYKRKLDKVTRLLCGVLTELEQPYLPERKFKAFKSAVMANPELVKWWAAHQKADASK